jgi:hypothetical protein
VPLSTDRTLREIIIESHKTALDHGWWESGDRPILEQLMLMVTELAEAVEEVRNGHGVGEVYYNPDRPVTNSSDDVYLKPEGFLAELADVLIRMGDTIGKYGLTDQFIKVLQEKLTYNKYRPYRHGGKTA